MERGSWWTASLRISTTCSCWPSPCVSLCFPRMLCATCVRVCVCRSHTLIPREWVRLTEGLVHSGTFARVLGAAGEGLVTATECLELLRSYYLAEKGLDSWSAFTQKYTFALLVIQVAKPNPPQCATFFCSPCRTVNLNLIPRRIIFLGVFLFLWMLSVEISV